MIGSQIMFYILNKQSKQIVWINRAENISSPEDIWGQYDSSSYIAVRSEFIKNLGEVFNHPLVMEKDEIFIVEPFQTLEVYNRATGEKRTIQSYQDIPIQDNETKEIPLVDYDISWQKFSLETSKWVVDLDKVKTIKSTEIISEYEKRMTYITSKYPLSEREGWSVKEGQARKWLGASSDEERESLKSELLILVNEADPNTNIGITALAQAIIRDSGTYQVYYGQQTKIHRSKLKEIKAATTIEQLKAIKYE